MLSECINAVIIIIIIISSSSSSSSSIIQRFAAYLWRWKDVTASSE